MKRAFVAVAILLLVGITGWCFGRPAYRHYRENRALAQAKHFLARQDFRGASLSARQVLLLNPANLAACEIMAQLAKKAGARQWLQWREKIAEIAPTLDNKLRLAEASLLLQEPPWPLAEKVLAEVASQALGSARFHVLMAELALKRNESLDAETHFLQAAQLEPSSPVHPLNLSVLRIRSTNALISGQARVTLEGLITNADVRPAALRTLVTDAISHTNTVRAKGLSDVLVLDPQADMKDHLQHLGLVRQLSPQEFDSVLGQFQLQLQTNAIAVQVLCDWLLGNGLVTNCLAWLDKLPPKVQQQPPVRLALADCLLALKSWPELERLLQNERWDDLEPVRLALLSRCASGQHHDTAAEAQWRLAVHSAGRNLGHLNALLNLASLWGREQHREDLLWNIARSFPNERWSFHQLEAIYSAEGNTRGLNKLYSAWAAADSANLVVRNNFIATSLLLGLNLSQAHEAARQNYSRNTTNAVLVSTYAYSLHLQSRTAEGLALLESLSRDQCRHPAIALYYAVLLCANGQSQKAGLYFTSLNETSLLPEERLLLSEAKRKGS